MSQLLSVAKSHNQLDIFKNAQVFKFIEWHGDPLSEEVTCQSIRDQVDVQFVDEVGFWHNAQRHCNGIMLKQGEEDKIETNFLETDFYLRNSSGRSVCDSVISNKC